MMARLPEVIFVATKLASNLKLVTWAVKAKARRNVNCLKHSEASPYVRVGTWVATRQAERGSASLCVSTYSTGTNHCRERKRPYGTTPTGAVEIYSPELNVSRKKSLDNRIGGQFGSFKQALAAERWT